MTIIPHNLKNRPAEGLIIYGSAVPVQMYWTTFNLGLSKEK